VTQLKKALVATTLLLLCIPAFLTGCGTRTVLVPHGEPVRLRKSIKNVPVWAADSKGVEVPGKVTLPEGWWALPLTPTKKPVSTNEFADPACCFVVTREGRGDGAATRKIFTK